MDAAERDAHIFLFSAVFQGMCGSQFCTFAPFIGLWEFEDVVLVQIKEIVRARLEGRPINRTDPVNFDAAGKEVPDFEYTPRSIAHLYNLATVSQAKTQAANIVANDFRQKAAEYRSQAARIREILENVGLAQESLPSNVVASAQVLANVANLLNIRDTELSSFLVAMGDISLRKTGVDEKRAKVHKESKTLLEYTRKAIARLTYLKRTLAQLEDDVAPCDAQMENWKTNLGALQNRVGYTLEINHGVLVEMAEHRKDLEKKTKPILDTLRSYQDLPPDKALAALAIEDKKRQYAAAEKYLEDVLQSALATSD
ncbi:hypothetical protein ES288_D05G008100v1 [Gossypium darwinii]|uniref:Uncharacterized protein n=1 Tax=Gossypium darwinii TaxID=34276 RepID=A0A5D2CAB1_GOSDA|nr:hypothetical protein ES288_D05G008100v1 [Gossypium darwinii]